MIAVPVSLFGTFGAFEVLGFTINTLTLFAMVLAIGLVVDDAIVVIEAVEYEMRYNNLLPKDATVAAMEKCRVRLSGLLSYWLLYSFRLPSLAGLWVFSINSLPLLLRFPC